MIMSPTCTSSLPRQTSSWDASSQCRRDKPPSQSQQKQSSTKRSFNHTLLAARQCCGSMTFWGGSGSADPCLWLMDPDSVPDPDPGPGSCYYCNWPSRCQQKTNFLTQFFLLITFWSYIYIIFQRLKIQQKSQNSRNQGFSYYFCMMIKGSGSGSIPLPSGSESGPGRPKNMWIRWIRIRNTAARINAGNLRYTVNIRSRILSPAIAEKGRWKDSCAS